MALLHVMIRGVNSRLDQVLRHLIHLAQLGWLGHSLWYFIQNLNGAAGNFGSRWKCPMCLFNIPSWGLTSPTIETLWSLLCCVPILVRCKPPLDQLLPFKPPSLIPYRCRRWKRFYFRCSSTAATKRSLHFSAL
jgi:hypothetical protein